MMITTYVVFDKKYWGMVQNSLELGVLFAG